MECYSIRPVCWACLKHAVERMNGGSVCAIDCVCLWVHWSCRCYSQTHNWQHARTEWRVDPMFMESYISSSNRVSSSSLCNSSDRWVTLSNDSLSTILARKIIKIVQKKSLICFGSLITLIYYLLIYINILFETITS